MGLLRDCVRNLHGQWQSDRLVSPVASPRDATVESFPPFAQNGHPPHLSHLSLPLTPVSGRLPDDVKSMHSTVGTLIAFLMAFRTSQSYTNYVEGRKILGGMCNNLREMAMNTYTFRACLEGEEGDEVAAIRRNIRRQINVLYAVIRQHVREYTEGFGESVRPL